ncbi:Transglycosylase SLT domain protein [Aminobacter sp. MSH1]|uniref:lytic transglycosylase domain-containing protein n=1 Tax=Aminobacter sp. MSH1 TaxID=374606 RepID=UPI000D504E39|nr:lytic transglycosylase domain-containing protein [Aminobacter sp. MSH1]AWC23050.1 Transglycosylase SLT domain protein [Aminobacter sp. MSH1]
MPAIKTHLLISAALATALLSGCQTNTAALSTDLSTGADVALSADTSLAPSAGADLALPETVAVVPTSFAAVEASPATAVLAAAAIEPDASDVTVAAAATAPAAGSVAVATASEAAKTPATTAPAPAAANAPVVAAAKAPVDPMTAPMAGGDIVAAASDPKLSGAFPPAPTLADYALPAKAPVPKSYQVASLGTVAPESFATSSYAAPDSPALASRGKIDELISKYAALYEVPEKLVRRVVNRESTFNPLAYNRGHWGLMQIKHATARGMGYDGPANGLLDAETNLKFAVKYLRGAFMVADGNEDQADKLYQSGYYYHAKRKGLLDETGLGRDRARHRG